MVNKAKMAEQILDTALTLAERSSWEAVRLCDVASELNISLRQISEHYAQKDDLAEAWFDRADKAMLEDAACADYLQLPARQRLHRSMMSWFDAMSEHRHVTGQMLLYKLEFGHIHLQALGIMRISRTVQWILEAAHRNAVNISRVFEEIALTSIYLGAFAFWLRDETGDTVQTSKFVESSLRGAEFLAYLIPGSGATRVPRTASWNTQDKRYEQKLETSEKVSRR